MAPARATSGLMSGLQSVEEKRLFDIVDKLRELDVNHELSLPQLVVCGSQSTGKSSVLEAISGIPFPSGEMTCTRFVTEIRYRRGDEEHLQVEIIPDEKRTPEERDYLRAAKFVNRDLRQLPDMIKDVERTLGLANNKAFTRDTLRVQITGRAYQPLTLVDLPGLIESHRGGSGPVRVVKSIVDDWISQERSIILAIVEANSDPQNQAILTRAKEEDPDGRRTFGIITKPDLAEHGSNLERCWIDHARNTPNGRAEFSLRKGWHVLRNRTYAERQASSDRDAIERQFFLDPERNWHVIEERSWGIVQLRTRLRTLLYEQTKKQLPKVRKDITAKLGNYRKELQSLEDRLRRPDRLWTEYNKECKELAVTAKTGVDGKHNHAIYANYDADPSMDLRARIEESCDNFSREMFTNDRVPAGENALPGSNEFERYMAEVERMLQKTKGEELPGSFDPQRVNLIFWRDSTPWRDHALELIEQAYSHCLMFVGQMINVHFLKKLRPGMPQAIFQTMVSYLEDSLGKQKDRAREELDKLEEDRKRPVKTRSRGFDVRLGQRVMASKMRRAKDSEDYQMANNNNNTTWETPMTLSKPETSYQSAEKLAGDALVYYEIARDVFVDNVLIQVVERNLLAPLHTLFHDDFGITRDDFGDMLTGEDNDGAPQVTKQELENKVSRLEACMAELR